MSSTKYPTSARNTLTHCFGFGSLTCQRRSRSYDRTVRGSLGRSARISGEFACNLRDLCGRCIPRLYAAASLKHARVHDVRAPAAEYSAALCRGLIEATDGSGVVARPRAPYSAALCRGLIEAVCNSRLIRMAGARIPRLYAAASLKHEHAIGLPIGVLDRIPRLYAAASLKRHRAQRQPLHGRAGIPRLYAAASLKRHIFAVWVESRHRYSAALCRGLIEALPPSSRALGRASVFRGFMPRPH